MDTYRNERVYLVADECQVADKSGPAGKSLRGWWCVVQRRLILCEGERSAARLYKPATLRLSHPLIPHACPHPQDGGSHPAADSPPKHSRPIKRIRVPRSQCSLLLSLRTTTATHEFVSRREMSTTRLSLGFLGMSVFYRCLTLKTSARGVAP